MITPIGDFTSYPNDLPAAIESFRPTMVGFRQLVAASSTSVDLLRKINTVSNPLRTQLLRVFRWMVSKAVPVELLKKKGREDEIIRDYQGFFTPITELREALELVTDGDAALAFVFWQSRTRGQTGYQLTEELFTWVEQNLSGIEISGPRGAGRDPPLSEFLPAINSTTPVDFGLFRIIEGEETSRQLVGVGWARYDSDRGGSQGDDRVGVNIDHAREVLDYNEENGTNIKVIFVNDGIGLNIGEMWDEYINLEEIHANVRVMTLAMLPEDLTIQWLVD